MAPSPGRLLLLVPTRTYRADAFMAAAERLRVQVDLAVTVASEEHSPLSGRDTADLLTLDFRDPERAAAAGVAFARKHGVRAVIGVDDQTAVAAAAVATELGLPHNSVDAARAAKNKHTMRERFRTAGLRVPEYRVLPLDADAAAVAQEIAFPCVLKPLTLAASQGVIRADDPSAFVAAFRRVVRIVRQEAAQSGGVDGGVLVEGFIPGCEVAVEGLLADGELLTLAVFDKPDPLDGPFFAETVYITPSRHSAETQRKITEAVAHAAAALGLRHGPIHAELRLNDSGPWVLEVAGRSIGGQCGRTLRFGAGMSLEELIIRQALGLEIETYERETEPAGVMMLPVPRHGVFRGVEGLDAARAVPGIEDISIALHPGQAVVPLPEGALYLGFIFARGDTTEAVDTALRAAEAALSYLIDPEP